MTLLDLINVVRGVAENQPQIAQIVDDDVYKLESMPSVKYGVFAYTQGVHQTEPLSDTTTYALTLFYVDRIADDRHNLAEIQSVGVQVLTNIINTLAAMGIYTTDSVTLQPFQQTFSDNCAGVYTSVGFVCGNDTICEQLYN